MFTHLSFRHKTKYKTPNVSRVEPDLSYLEQSKLLTVSGNWNDLWMFKVAKLLTIVLAKTKLSTLSCITIKFLDKNYLFPKKHIVFLLSFLLFRHCIKKHFLWFLSSESCSNNSLGEKTFSIILVKVSILLWPATCILSPDWPTGQSLPEKTVGCRMHFVLQSSLETLILTSPF